ncbi:MAG: glycoside hydrolase family 5 protein [Chloroflexi bacterium]|nr:glycoside hydrolase family 5 protein [Chloroflexota bacterium]
MKRRIAALVTIIIIAVAAFYIINRPDDTETPSSSLPYGSPPDYGNPTELAPDAVNVDDSHHFPSLTYGIHGFMWWDGLSRNHMLDSMNIMQFSHVRQSFAWADLEPEPLDLNLPINDRYHWQQADAMMEDISAKGIKVVARIDHAPEWAVRQDVPYENAPFNLRRLRELCSAIATRYKGRIDAYQIWNEPNLNREWGGYPPSPSGYVQLLATCSTAIREADPDAIIITAGLSPTGTRDLTAMPDDEYLWKLYETQAFPRHFDVLGLHAPGFKYAPETDPQTVVDKGGLRWQTFRHVEHMRAIMVASGDSETQVAITEMGWTIDPRPESSYHWFAVSLEEQADYLARAYRYAAENWRPWVGLVSAIYLPAPHWTEDDEQYWWAIGTPAPAPWLMDTRPAYAALVEMRKISTNPDYDHPARDPSGNPIIEDDDEPAADG